MEVILIRTFLVLIMSQASDDEEDYMSDAFLLKWCVFLLILL